MKLFDIPKVSLFLDTITHGTEKRDDDETKIVTLTLRVPDLSPTLASALPDGIKLSIFRTNGEPKRYIGRMDFRFGFARQLLTVFAAPDHTASAIAFDQAKVTALYARVDKDSTVVQFIVKVSFGPLSKTELEYIEDWRLNQRWVTFDEAEPGLFDEVDSPTTTRTAADDDEADRPLPLDGAAQ